LTPRAYQSWDEQYEIGLYVLRNFEVLKMRKSRLNYLSDDILVTCFAEAAAERGAAVLDSEVRRANRDCGDSALINMR